MLTINSTSDAFKFLYGLSLKTSNLRFRGQANLTWPLTPSIYRYSNFKRYQAIIHERDLMSFRPQFLLPPLTHTNYEIEWLMVCQHNEIPTRLLDWTSDILIALFFACFDKEQIRNDGALFVCNHNDYPQFQMYHERIIREKQLAFVNTYLTNPKMRYQSGCFMLWGASPLNDSATESYDLWEYFLQNKKDAFFKKVIIPQSSKEKILKELKEIYGIDEEAIYVKNGNPKIINSYFFKFLKERLRLMTLYQTVSGVLNLEERKVARTFFRIDCENWLGGCVNLIEYNDNRFPQASRTKLRSY